MNHMGVNIKYLLFVITLISLLAVYRKPLKIDKLTKDQKYVIELMKPFNIKHRARIRTCILRYAYLYDHPVPLFARLIKFESGFDRLAISRKGALGLGQVMPVWKDELRKCQDGRFGRYMDGQTNKNYKRYFYYIGVNLEMSAKILRKYTDKYGSYQLGLCRYNMRRKAFNKILKKPETARHYRYVKEIMNE